jgi:hypothetical protein
MVLTFALAAASPTLAAEPAPRVEAGPSSWTSRYEAARARFLAGDYATAEAELRELAETAESDVDRRLAIELADIAAALVARATPRPKPSPAPAPNVRSRDEISILYASAFLYGAGTGVWFLLQIQPDSALTATLPFAAITAAPIIGLATIDGRRPLRRGVPHGITAGLYLGVGEGIWLASYQHARAHRIDAAGGGSSRWGGEAVATLLWGGATLGGITGGALAGGLTTTPGRISYTASTTIWLGLISGLGTAAILPESPHRQEMAALAAGGGYNVGLFGGMLMASRVSPSVTRVRLVDLSGAAGALAAAGSYLSLAHRDTDPRIGLGLAAGGAAVGLAVGTLLTAGMEPELPTASVPPPRSLTWQPLVAPAPGGATVGVGGVF